MELAHALLWVIRGVDVLRCLFAIRGGSPCIFIEDFLDSFLDSLLFFFILRISCPSPFSLSLSHGDFFSLLRFSIYFFSGFSRSSWYRKEVSFWAYLEGDILFVAFSSFLGGGFGYDCFWTRDTGFIF